MSQNPVDIHVGQKLLLRRNMMNMSQEEVGNAVGVTFQQIQKYEKGANRIGASRLFEIAKILKVNVDYFFDGIEKQAAAQGFAESGQSDFEFQKIENKESMALVRAFNKIESPVVRKRILSMVQSLSAENLSKAD